MLLLFAVGPVTPYVGIHELPLYLSLGLPAVILGLILRLWSRGYTRAEGFVWDGPYRYMRNPVESGALFAFAGAAVVLQLPWWYILLCLLLALAYLNFASLHYEREFYLRFGAPFLRYKQRVRRWIPSSLPGANRSNRSFRMAHAFYNERLTLLWLLGYAAVFALRRHFRTV